MRGLRTSVVPACLGAAAVALGSGAAVRATTQPGMLFFVRLVITDEKVLIRGDKFMTRTGIPHYPRGTDVRYAVRNRGSRPVSLNILGSSTGRLAPGQQRHILVYWSRRGKFVFRARPNGPALRIWVV